MNRNTQQPDVEINTEDTEHNQQHEHATDALSACQREVERWRDSYIRITADLENIKRRSFKEQEQAVIRSLMRVFTDLLPVIDNFDRALEATSASVTQDNALYNGLLLIRKELMTVLERHGVKAMPPATLFDPELQEAISQVEDTNKPSGTIIAILEKGYMYKDHVLRPARVTVAQ